MRKILVCLMTALLLLGLMPATNNANVYAEYTETSIEVTTAKTELDKFLAVAETRYTGSEGANLAASYLKSRLGDGMRANNVTTIEGIGYSAMFSGNMFSQYFTVNKGSKSINSQNVVGCLPNPDSDKYVIIGAHYDNVEADENNGVSDNASGVAATLVLAKQLKQQNLPYNLIIAFYGAEELDRCGSRYFVENLPANIKENIILSITLDSVGAGDYQYYYTSEFKTDYGDYIANKAEETDFVKTPDNVLYSTQYNDNYAYTVLPQNSDNFSYMTEGINSLLLFAGNVNTQSQQYKETDDNEVVMHGKDNVENIEEKFGLNFYANITLASNFVYSIVTAEDFASIEPNQECTTLTNIWFIKLCAFIIIVVQLLVLFVIFMVKTKKIHWRKPGALLGK